MSTHTHAHTPVIMIRRDVAPVMCHLAPSVRIHLPLHPPSHPSLPHPLRDAWSTVYGLKPKASTTRVSLPHPHNIKTPTTRAQSRPCQHNTGDRRARIPQADIKISQDSFSCTTTAMAQQQHGGKHASKPADGPSERKTHFCTVFPSVRLLHPLPNTHTTT